MAGKKISERDAARLGRMLLEWEADQAHTSSADTQPTRGDDLRGLLLDRLDGEEANGDAASVSAVVLEYCPAVCFVLRVPSTDARKFHLAYNGDESDELDRNATAETIRQAVESLTDQAVEVVGKGSEIGPDDVTWSPPIWFVRFAADAELDAPLTISTENPANPAAATIQRSTDWPLDRLVEVFPRFAGDQYVEAGAIVSCRVSPGLGWRVWSARLNVTACPAQNAQIRVTLPGPPTGGTWSITLVHHNADDPDTEITETTTETVAGLAWDCNAAQLQEAIDASAHFAEKVNVTGGPAHQSSFNLEFHGELGNQFVPLPFVNWANLEGNLVTGHSYYNIVGRAAEVTT